MKRPTEAQAARIESKIARLRDDGPSDILRELLARSVESAS